MCEQRINEGATRGESPIVQLLAAVDDLWPHVQDLGIAVDRDSLISAAAVGLVEQVWRNGPVEDAHGSRRGPSDGEMMAESLHLYGVARNILDRDVRWPFLDLTSDGPSWTSSAISST